MITLTLNNQQFQLPTQHTELGKKQLLRLQRHLLANENSLTSQMQFIVSRLKLKKLRTFEKKAAWLQDQGLDDFQWEALLNECSPLFGPIRHLPFKTLRHRLTQYKFCSPYLDNLTFGRWCILNETLNALNLQVDNKEAYHNLQIIGQIILDKKCPKTPWFMAMVVRYAQGCVLNVIDMPAYSPFFKGEKKESEAPAFGWYSLANSLAKNGPFGNLEQLKSSPIHEVLMHLTEQAIEARKEKFNHT